MTSAIYTEKQIQSLDWRTHIRHRPGMYIGKLGDGSSADDGIYILLKEIVDNTIDEHIMGYGKKVDIFHMDNQITVRDYGRGIPLGKVVDCVAKMNTGGKYDSQAFKKSVGLNGVGTKAVNALSKYFRITTIRDGKKREVLFHEGVLQQDSGIMPTNEKNGTEIVFTPDPAIFGKYTYQTHLLDRQLRYYTYLNRGLTLYLNRSPYKSTHGLLDLLQQEVGSQWEYPIIHLKKEDCEIALTHHKGREIHFSFVNGQFTSQGGTHLLALRESLVKSIREFYKKEFEVNDIRQHWVVALSIRVEEPIFESQTKTKLGSKRMAPDGMTMRRFMQQVVQQPLDNYLHQHKDSAEKLLETILRAERARKALVGVKKLAREGAKKASLHNSKLRDCTTHYTDRKKKRHQETMLFITEGKSATGSITKSRDPATQAVFSLRGKPLNTYGSTEKIVYQNEEFNLLLHAAGLDRGLPHLRYNKLILATDADVDGMHIRLLMMTYFLQFFPEFVSEGHLYILETPLFRVRNKKTTYYCYNEQEKIKNLNALGSHAEITRFKGLGEISPHEIKQFIGKKIRLRPIKLLPELNLEEMLRFYMGRNTPERQQFIIQNLRQQPESTS